MTPLWMTATLDRADPRSSERPSNGARATRYDKLAIVDREAVVLQAITLWLKRFSSRGRCSCNKPCNTAGESV